MPDTAATPWRSRQKPTPAQAELLALLHAGYRIARGNYLIDPSGRPLAGYVNTMTKRACERAAWIRWDGRGWVATEAAPTPDGEHLEGPDAQRSTAR